MMRRILLPFVVPAFLFVTSCEDIISSSASGPEADPMTECVVPSSVSGGEEVILQWNGFKDGDLIVLKSASQVEHIADILTLNGSGLIFSVPFSIEPGEYSIILRRESDIEIGIIGISAPEIPFIGISVPSSAIAGNELTVAGIGFDDSVTVIFVSENAGRVKMEGSVGTGGITVEIPSDMLAGSYDVYLSYMGYEWKIADVAVSTAIRKLQSITYIGPYYSSMEVAYAWSVSDDLSEITLTESLVEGNVFTENASDVYLSSGQMSYVLGSDGLEMSNNLAVTYILDSEGKVTASDVLIYGDDEATRFDWAYNPEGMLTEVTFESTRGKMSHRSLAYEDGNLVRFGSYSFEYADPELKNNPFAPDVVWGYMAVMDKFDPFLHFPYLTGLYNKASVLLPTSVIFNDGGSEVTLPLSYSFDDDGYVVEMSWLENRSLNRILFATSL